MDVLVENSLVSLFFSLAILAKVSLLLVGVSICFVFVTVGGLSLPNLVVGGLEG